MGHIAADNFLSLVAALHRRFAIGQTRLDPIGEEIRRVLELLGQVSGQPLPSTPTRHPLIRHLPAALTLAEASAPDLVAALRSVGELLPWRYGYAARGDAPGLESAMGWAELVGPAAPLRSEQVCLGFTLIGPETFYLPHRHPAVELYHVVAGTAEWMADDVARSQPPGAYILHGVDQVHAMRTGSEPLLAIYSWTGDVHSPSVWVD